MKSKKVNVVYATAFNEENNRLGKQHIEKKNGIAYCGYNLGKDIDQEKFNDNNICKSCFRAMTAINK